jgi:hypothetical protein
MMNMEHEALREAILAGDSDAMVLAHLEVCDECASLAKEIEKVDLLGGSLVVPPPSAGLQERVLGDVLAHYERHRSVREAVTAGDRDATVLAHLEVCSDCTSLAEEMDKVDELAASLVVPPPSAGLQERVLQHVLAHFDRHAAVREAIFAGISDASVRTHLKVCTDCATLAEEIEEARDASTSSPPEVLIAEGLGRSGRVAAADSSTIYTEYVEYRAGHAPIPAAELPVRLVNIRDGSMICEPEQVVGDPRYLLITTKHESETTPWLSASDWVSPSSSSSSRCDELLSFAAGGVPFASAALLRTLLQLMNDGATTRAFAKGLVCVWHDVGGGGPQVQLLPACGDSWSRGLMPDAGLLSQSEKRSAGAAARRWWSCRSTPAQALLTDKTSRVKQRALARRRALLRDTLERAVRMLKRASPEDLAAERDLLGTLAAALTNVQAELPAEQGLESARNVADFLWGSAVPLPAEPYRPELVEGVEVPCPG